MPLDSSQNQAVLPAHPAGSMPLDQENKQHIQTAKQEFKAREQVGVKLTSFLNRIANEIDALDREKRLALFRQQIKAHQYMDGNFYGYVDQNCEWQQKQKGPDEVWYSNNQLTPYLETALMELSRTQTEVLIQAPPGADDSLVAAAKFAKARYDANRDRTFNARLKQTENTYALLNGITFRYTFAQFSNGRTERVPKLQKTEPGETETKKLCAMCSRPQVELPDVTEITGAPMPKADPKCRHCGSEMFLEIGMSEQPDTIIGYENIPNCQNSWIVPNPVGITVSLQASCIEETPFIKWKQMIVRSVLQSKFKGMELPSTGTESVELRYITNQQKATPAATNAQPGYDSNAADTTGRELELLEFQQIWLDYSMYCDQTFDEDTPLGRGKVLPKGKPLGSAYPNGCYYARCDQMIVDIWNEDKNRKWSSSPYGLRPGSMYGRASHPALSDQEVLNDVETLLMANAWSNGVPREFVDPEYINELSADPQVPTKLLTPMGQAGNIIGRAYGVAEAQNLSTEIYGIRDKKESAIQNKIGAMSGTGAGGLADTQKWGDTATAISIKRDLAVGRFSPHLELMADQLDIPQAKQFLQNEQQYFTPAQWKKAKGEHGDDALAAFLKCDLLNDLIYTISPGSYMPKSDAQVQAKLLSYADLLPVLAQLNNPEIIAYASEVFGIPEHLGGWNSDRAHAGKVIKRFQALAELFIENNGDLPTNALDPVPGPIGPDGQPVMVPSLAMIVAQKINNYSKMPVDVFLDNHVALQDAYRDWRTTDEGQEASNAMLAAVALRVNLHQEGIAKQGQILTRTALAAQQPLKEDAAADQQKLLEADNAAKNEAADQAETQMQAEGVKELVNQADKDDQRTHEKDLQESKQAHERDLEAAKLLVAAETAKSKDTAKPSKKA